MTNWNRDELKRIGGTDEIQLSSFKQDGTLQKPVTIWVVPVDDALYVRAYRGRECPWFRRTQQQQEGQISADGITKHVAFVDIHNDERLAQKIDAAYQSKYKQYGPTYVDPMLALPAHTATLKLLPIE